jgi:hypothetical protein
LHTIYYTSGTPFFNRKHTFDKKSEFFSSHPTKNCYFIDNSEMEWYNFLA